MNHILTLLRTKWNVKVTQTYYANKLDPNTVTASIISYTNALIQIPGLSEVETYQIDLSLTEDELFRRLKKSNRNEINQAASKLFTHIIDTHPSNTDLLLIQQFYNVFAKKKHTYKCKEYHLKPMKLLRD